MISFLKVTTNIIIILFVVTLFYLIRPTRIEFFVIVITAMSTMRSLNLVPRSGLTLLAEMKLSKLLFQYLCSPKIRWVNQSVVYI